MTTSPDVSARVAPVGWDAALAALTVWIEAAERYADALVVDDSAPTAIGARASVDIAYELAGRVLAWQHACVIALMVLGRRRTQELSRAAHLVVHAFTD